jgi:hypothetical protein
LSDINGSRSGGIENRDQVLNAKKSEKGDCMMICVSRAKPGEKLMLDL